MNKLEAVDPDSLRAALAEADNPKAVKRLMIALAYRDGVPVETLSERYGTLPFDDLLVARSVRSGLDCRRDPR